MNALLVTLMLAQPLPHGYGLLELNHSPGLTLHLNDDILLSFGNTSAAPDIWFEWDTSGTDALILRSTDIDGVGTDGTVWYVDTGTDDVVFNGSIRWPDYRQAVFGSGSDYLMRYRGGAETLFELYSSDVDGGGTDGTIFWANDGAPYLYIGALTQAVRLDASADARLSVTEEDGTSLTLAVASVQSVAAGDSLTLSSYSTSGAVATGNLDLYSGNNTNAGDYDSGRAAFGSGGASGTGADSGPVWIYSGAAQDQAGDLVFAVDGAPGVGTTFMTMDASTSSVDVSVSKIAFDGATGRVVAGTVGGEMLVDSETTSTTTATGAVSLRSGANTNASSGNSGAVSVYSGNANAGNSGGVNIWSGDSTSGTVGNVQVLTGGGPGTGTTGLSISGSTSSIELARLSQEDAPGTCTVGELILDNGGGTVELCYCQAANTWYCSAMAAGPTD